MAKLNTLPRPLSITLRRTAYAMAAGLVVLTCNASAQYIEAPLPTSALPTSPSRPTSLGECEALEKKFSLPIQKLQATRDRCLRSDTSRADTDSRCGPVQSSLNATAKRARQEDFRCRSLVAAQRDKQRRAQELARAQQHEATAREDARRAAAVNHQFRTQQQTAQARRQEEGERRYAADARRRNAAAARAAAQRSAVASRKRR
jgi:regulator of protease activity HflC (stomatin/prohibitin superfamily)